MTDIYFNKLEACGNVNLFFSFWSQVNSNSFYAVLLPIFVIINQAVFRFKARLKRFVYQLYIFSRSSNDVGVFCSKERGKKGASSTIAQEQTVHQYVWLSDFSLHPLSIQRIVGEKTKRLAKRVDGIQKLSVWPLAVLLQAASALRMRSPDELPPKEKVFHGFI